MDHRGEGMTANCRDLVSAMDRGEPLHSYGSQNELDRRALVTDSSKSMSPRSKLIRSIYFEIAYAGLLTQSLEPGVGHCLIVCTKSDRLVLQME